MPPAKRWYQLSLLQIVVTMAVVAGFLALNIPNSRSETEVITDLGIAVRKAGWPLHYYTVVGLESPTEIESERFLFDRPGEVSWWLLSLNVLACLFAMVFVLKCVAGFSAIRNAGRS